MALQEFQGLAKVYVNGSLVGKIKTCEVRQAVSIANGQATIELENITQDYDSINVNDTVEVYASDKWTTNKLLFKGFVRDVEHIVRHGENIIRISAVDDTAKLHARYIDVADFYVWEIGDLVKEIVKDLGFDTSNVDSSFLYQNNFEDGADPALNGWSENLDAQWSLDNTSQLNGTYSYKGVGDGTSEQYTIYTLGTAWTDYAISLLAKSDAGYDFGIYFRAATDLSSYYKLRIYQSGNGAVFEIFRKTEEGELRLYVRKLNEFHFELIDLRLVCIENQIRVYVKDMIMNNYTKVVDTKDDKITSGTIGLWVSADTTAYFDDIKVIAEENLVEHYQAKGRSYFDALQDLAELKAIYDEYHDFWVDDGKLYFVKKNYASTGVTVGQTDEITSTKCAIVEANIRREIHDIRNKIIVFGATVSPTIPASGDEWSEGNIVDKYNAFAFRYIGDNGEDDKRNAFSPYMSNGGGKDTLYSVYQGSGSIGYTAYGKIYGFIILPEAIDVSEAEKFHTWLKFISGQGVSVTTTFWLCKDIQYEFRRNNTGNEYLTPGSKIATKFTAKDTDLWKVWIPMGWDTSDVYLAVTVKICPDSNGEPDESNPVKTVGFTYDSDNDINDFGGTTTGFSADVTLTKDATYWLVIEVSSSSGQNLKIWKVNDENRTKEWNGTNWVDSAYDVQCGFVYKPKDYFSRGFSTSDGSWTEVEDDIGIWSNWSSVGNPTWSEIKAIGFHYNVSPSNGRSNTYLDEINFKLPTDKIKVVAEDANSQTEFGIREMVINDATASTKERAEAIARAKLALMKDLKYRGRVVCNGNVNLQAGKSVTVNIPLQGINLETMRILEAVHRFNNETKEYYCELMLDEELPVLELLLKNQQKALDEVRARIAVLEASQIKI